MIKCKAIVTQGDGKFSLQEISVPAPKSCEVLIKIMASGICHTDYDSLSWGRSLIMGHEGAGIVTAVGTEVTSVQVGDRVLLNWAIPCGSCLPCSMGDQNICEVNSFVTGKKDSYQLKSCCHGKEIDRSFHLGTMSEYTLVKEAAVIKLHDDVPFTVACIMGCGVMTGVGSAINAAKVTPGSSCAVIGCGGVGLNVIQGCRIAGAQKIIAIDVNETRLKMAKEYGATHTILADAADVDFISVKQAVKALTEGRGSDYAFECTAIPALGAAPLALIRNAGTAIQASGIEQKISFDCELFEWDKIYLNPLYGKCRPKIDFPKLQNFYRDGSLLLDSMISKTYTLEQLAEAFADMRAGTIAKGVILINSEKN
jgi:Zn-dependent alcohol dehydrogenase